MSAQGSKIVDMARNWIGTPYVHQASFKGAGCDCLGLLRGIWREVAGAEPETVPAYSMDWSEPQGDERLWRAAVRYLTPKQAGHEDAGDILLFRMRSGAVAKHIGIAAMIGSDATFIHAYSGHGVRESPLSLPWRRRVVARFEIPAEAV